MMRLRHVPSRLGLSAVLALAACTSAPKPSFVPPQTVEMDRETLRKFQHEVEEYIELRKEVLKEIPPVAADASADQLANHQKALTDAIIAYRKGKKRGDIFKPSVEAAIRRVLHEEFSGPDGPAIIDGVKQGNPKVEGNPLQQDPSKESRKAVTIAVNARYPAGAPYSSVPPSLLLKLPLLPEQVRYRFVGRALILRDTEANVILDYIDDVVPDTSIPR